MNQHVITFTILHSQIYQEYTERTRRRIHKQYD